MNLTLTDAVYILKIVSMLYVTEVEFPFGIRMPSSMELAQ
jgi:hypothetical protein